MDSQGFRVREDFVGIAYVAAIAAAVAYMVMAQRSNYSVFEVEAAVPGIVCRHDHVAIDSDFEAHTAAAVIV